MQWDKSSLQLGRIIEPLRVQLLCFTTRNSRRDVY